METREVAEVEALSAWFATATPDPDLAVSLWRENAHLPRRLQCGMAFDIVMADRSLISTAYRLLAQYEQPLGPAVLFTSLRSAAVLVPVGTALRWNSLMATAQWPERRPRPACLSAGHVILVPAPRPAGLLAQWLEPPDDEQAIGGAPLLTSPVPLARCITEAQALLGPPERTPLRRTVSAVRSLLHSPQRT
ncbi:hypothetical protein IM697_18330 [Streptomyces ferrugineus]|uniref:DNA primase/polymerase bifunctional N-terminal domain-containing protein n=1 Tax=Streptomyces ferrugineus TaxID=1413221 RepID=A0A7M2SV04_9ACTN|nr:hypothetical protein [Streptomyces ferrugineus]QOV40180.1 hypothetical protein IM697_18330 [Streptomyces ferrugineus]